MNQLARMNLQFSLEVKEKKRPLIQYIYHIMPTFTNYFWFLFSNLFSLFRLNITNFSSRQSLRFSLVFLHILFIKNYITFGEPIYFCFNIQVVCLQHRWILIFPSAWNTAYGNIIFIPLIRSSHYIHFLLLNVISLLFLYFCYRHIKYIQSAYIRVCVCVALRVFSSWTYTHMFIYITKKNLINYCKIV